MAKVDDFCACAKCRAIARKIHLTDVPAGGNYGFSNGHLFDKWVFLATGRMMPLCEIVKQEDLEA